MIELWSEKVISKKKEFLLKKKQTKKKTNKTKDKTRQDTNKQKGQLMPVAAGVDWISPELSKMCMS